MLGRFFIACFLEGGIGIKQKGNTKRVGKPNFWGKYENNVSADLKEMVYSQYYSRDTLSIYVDGSSKGRLMAAACSYVQNASIIVKQQLVHPPQDCIAKNFYSELRAVIFGLTHFEKYKQNGCEQVILYSDIADIKEFLYNEITFRKCRGLRKVQAEMIQLYQEKKEQSDMTISIKYLPVDQKKHNPLARSSHNGAKRMLNGVWN